LEKVIFIGYPEGYKGWKFYIPSMRCTIISERVEFNEDQFPMKQKQAPKTTTSSNENITNVNMEPTEEKRPPLNNSQENHEGNTSLEEVIIDPPCEETIRIGLRPPTQDR